MDLHDALEDARKRQASSSQILTGWPPWPFRTHSRAKDSSSWRVSPILPIIQPHFCSSIREENGCCVKALPRHGVAAQWALQGAGLLRVRSHPSNHIKFPPVDAPTPCRQSTLHADSRPGKLLGVVLAGKGLCCP